MLNVSTPRFPTALLACLSIACAAAFAQEETTSTDDGPFFEQVAVSVVNVEVYVTDKDDNPITSLTRDDFEITEDGRPVEVVNFYRVAGGRPDDQRSVDAEQELDSEPTPRDQPPLSPLVTVAPEVPDSQRLHVIVYVDNFNIHPLNRNRVFSQLRLFLNNTIRDRDEVMIASYDRSLNIRHPFTSNTDSINRGLLEIEELSGMAVEREAERAEILEKIFDTDSMFEALWAANRFAENQNHELGNTLNALTEMLESLAGLPGRKMMLYVSDGLPMIPGQDLYQAVQQKFSDRSVLSEALARDNSRRFMRLIAKANSNRVSFYTLDASGLDTRIMGAEARAVRSQIGVNTSVSSVRARNLQGSLQLMADRTGGRAIFNTNDVSEGLKRIASDFSNYYSLGYREPAADRGRYHRIEVRLKNPERGWKLRHREGYRDKSLAAQIEDGVKAFLVHGYETNPLGVRLEIGEAGAPNREGFVQLPIRISVPIGNIVLLPRSEFFEGRLRLYFGAVDEEGRDAPLRELPFELRIPSSSVEIARSDEMVRVVNATMRPGSHKLVVAVRDEFGDERSFVGRWLTIQM